MKVILLNDVAKIGHKYDVKDVASGYAANYLFPRKLAEPATAARVKSIEKLQAQAAEERRIQHELLAKNFGALKDVTVTVAGKANEQGHLFKAIKVDEIVSALREQAHVDIAPEMIKLEHSVKALGETKVTVEHGESHGSFTLSVEAEE